MAAAGGPGDTDWGGTELYTQKLVAFALPGRGAPAAGGGDTAAPAAPRAAAVAPPPAGGAARVEEGRALAEDRCTACHGLSTATAPGRSVEAWTLTVNEMIGLGAQVTDDQAAAIVQYLSRTFPAKQ